MPHFAATIQNIAAGVNGFTIQAAAKSIEAWEHHLAAHESGTSKTIIRDLVELREQITAEPIDTHAVKRLVAKLGQETVVLAARAEPAVAQKIRHLGQALIAAAAPTAAIRK
jgi:hypothetical protein